MGMLLSSPQVIGSLVLVPGHTSCFCFGPSFLELVKLGYVGGRYYKHQYQAVTFPVRRKISALLITNRNTLIKFYRVP